MPWTWPSRIRLPPGEAESAAIVPMEVVGGLPGTYSDLAIAGGWLVAAGSEGGIDVFDLREPAAPRPVSSVATRHRLGSLRVVGEAVFGLIEGQELVEVDLSTAAEPVLRRSLSLGSREARRFALGNGRAFFALGAMGAVAAPLQTSSQALGAPDAFTSKVAEDLAVEGSTLFVVGGSRDSSGTLRTFGLTEAGRPRPLASLGIPSSGSSITLAGSGRVLVTALDFGLTSVDVSDPARPFRIGTLQSPAIVDLMVEGERAYLADCVAGLRIVHMDGGGAPRLVGELALPTAAAYGCGASSVAVHEGFAYLSSGLGGVRIVAIGGGRGEAESDPDDPRGGLPGALARP